MNDIMQAIKEAEEQAVLTEEGARLRASEIISQAEADAEALMKAARIKAKNIRENGLRVAQEKAETQYRAAIEKSQKDAVAFAEENAGKVEQIARDVVRRLCSGR